MEFEILNLQLIYPCGWMEKKCCSTRDPFLPIIESAWDVEDQLGNNLTWNCVHNFISALWRSMFLPFNCP
jgi:hypothetical protein